jgi:transposase
MARDFLPYSLDQQYLLPVSPRDWLPDGHLALFLGDVVGQLDLDPIFRAYPRGRGPRGYHPQMLLAVLLYGYSVGVFSSRRLAAHCETEVAFRVLSGGAMPDFRTLSDFRKRHLKSVQSLFIEVLGLCREAGLVKLGHLSLDGSKYQANASKHKAMSYGRIKEVEPKLEAEVKELLRKAEAVDRAEDEEHGVNRRGDELPEELQRRESRLTKIREAKARLEERAKTRVEERKREKGATAEEVEAAGRAAKPKDKEQSNFTDPDSRIMKTKNGWIQGYNAQVMVDESSGVIVAEEVGNRSTDSTRLAPMLDKTDANLVAVGVSLTERSSMMFSADAGYCSEANLQELEDRKIDSYVATGRERHHRGGVDPTGKPQTPKRAAMRAKLQTDEGRAIYARRKCITEPVHGLIKQARGFRQFLLRGVEKVQAEFALIALTHNLLKLWRAQRARLAA